MIIEKVKNDQFEPYDIIIRIENDLDEKDIESIVRFASRYAKQCTLVRESIHNAITKIIKSLDIEDY